MRDAFVRREAPSSDDRTVESGRSTYDDVLEAQRFRDFLPTKNGVMVFGLVGDGRYRTEFCGVTAR